jgi:2-keto-4-pentenoate hydratase/2-oxohepta-3-ene-1,7-dioic acid hydratase in catechol pathway
MPRTLIHYSQHGQARWAVQFDQHLAPLDTSATTTGDVLAKHWDNIWEMPASAATVALADVQLLSPITRNQQLMCQGVNYRSHVQESGLKLSDFPFNTLFTKAASSLTAANAPVACPPHVRLLDYEVELGLVLRRDLPQGTEVQPDQLHHWLAGVTIVNDLSARDIQLPQGQFYKGKSYRGFAPVGPGLVLLEPEEWARWPQLHMRLSVNGQTRQDAYCGDMIHQPAATLRELAGLQDMHAGDLIATGTPAGCAARAPGRLTMLVAKMFLSDAAKWRLFIRKGLRNPAYLRPGDRIAVSIRTDDGAIDLGQQNTLITAA